MKAKLDSPVLVLNRLWQPIQTTSARRALKLLFLGHAQVVQTEGAEQFQTHDLSSWIEHSSRAVTDEIIRTVRLALRIPKIIVLGFYDKLPKIDVKFSRTNVFLRDKHTCQYCGNQFSEKDLNLDHVIPRDKGGGNSWENIVTSCIRCNTKKSNHLPQEINMFPIKKPIAPRWRPLYGIHAAKFNPAWAHFLPSHSP